jgi:hypothetical protein
MRYMTDRPDIQITQKTHEDTHAFSLGRNIVTLIALPFLPSFVCFLLLPLRMWVDRKERQIGANFFFPLRSGRGVRSIFVIACCLLCSVYCCHAYCCNGGGGGRGGVKLPTVTAEARPQWVEAVNVSLVL